MGRVLDRIMDDGALSTARPNLPCSFRFLRSQGNSDHLRIQKIRLRELPAPRHPGACCTRFGWVALKRLRGVCRAV